VKILHGNACDPYYAGLYNYRKLKNYCEYKVKNLKNSSTNLLLAAGNQVLKPGSHRKKKESRTAGGF
jgi:hypothetical protein